MTKYESESEKTEKQLAKSDSVADGLSVDEWLKVRKEAGLRIDPETAEVDWRYALTLDSYGVGPELPKEARQVGREYFARSPKSDIWVWFGDLPKEVRENLWELLPTKLEHSNDIFDFLDDQ
jgi:hypothetical protein